MSDHIPPSEIPMAFAEKCGEVERLKRELQLLAVAVRKVKANSYLDDDVLNRHAFTTVNCAALRELFAALAASDGGGCDGR